jgi:CBS domain-containing protein
MTTARDMMHEGATCIPEHETLDRAAEMMRMYQVGSLPVCGDDDRLKGIITDRDIVVKCVALGRDPAYTTAAELAEGDLVWVDAMDDADEVLAVMADHLIRRVPVLENKHLVGMISEADVATHLPAEKVAAYCSAVYSAPSHL